jgi:hypothetical protein
MTDYAIVRVGGAVDDFIRTNSHTRCRTDHSSELSEIRRRRLSSLASPKRDKDAIVTAHGTSTLRDTDMPPRGPARSLRSLWRHWYGARLLREGPRRVWPSKGGAGGRLRTTRMRRRILWSSQA